MIKLKECPICNSKAIKLAHEISYHTHPSPHLEGLKDTVFSYFKCSECKAIFLNPMYTIEYTEEVHKTNANAFVWQDSYFDYVEKNGSSGYAPVANEIKNQIIKNGTRDPEIIDIGSGTGALLNEIRKVGFTKLLGIEPGPQGKDGSKKYNLNIENIGITKFNSTKKFDVVLVMDVIEHIPDTHALLQKIDSLIAPNGLLIVNTPNAGSLAYMVKQDQWSALTPPPHLILWHKKTFEAIAKRYNYQIVANKFTSFGLLNAIIVRLPNSFIKSKLQDLSNYLQNGFISIPFNDSIFVVLKKN